MTDIDLDRLAQTYGIRLLLQFGSTVTGGVHPGSDIDLAVLLERVPLTLDEHAKLLHELQRLFPERDVDLAILNHADPLFLKKVTDRCHLLFGPSPELARLKLQAFRRYQEHQKYFDLERRFVAKAITDSADRG